LSPYEQPQIVDDQIGYIEKSSKGNALVVKNTDGKETLRKSIDTTGGGVIANSSWCVWEKDDNPSSTIYLYDRKSGKIDTYDLGKNQFYSYALSGDYLIINSEAGPDSDSPDMAINAVNLNSRKETFLRAVKNESYGYTAQYPDSISFEIGKSGSTKTMIGMIK
jgi:hypothetical protein